MNRNLIVFTSEFYILVLLPNLTQILNLNNNLDQICHLVSPFSLPTLFFDGSALCIDLVCQTNVTGSTASSAAAGGFGLGGIGNSSVAVAVWLAVECTGHFLLRALGILLLLALQITIPVLFYIFTNGAIWSPSTFLFYLLQCHSGMGDHSFIRQCLNFYCGVGCRCWGNCPVFSGLKQVFRCLPCFRPWSACSSRDILKWWRIVIS